MPINIVWEDDEKTIIRISVSGKWTLKEFNDCFDVLVKLYSSTSNKVDMIVDARKNQTNMLNAISSLGRMDRSTHPNHRSITIVGSNPILRVVGNISQRVAPHISRNLGFVDTIEEAHARILQLRARLNASRA